MTARKESDPNILRKKAEDVLKKKSAKTCSQLSEAEQLKIIHDLEVHQIELELINEQLMEAKDKIEDDAEKYSYLYDFAPSGYFTLSQKGEIIEINLTGAKMLGKERIKLNKAMFGFYLSSKTKPAFYLFLDRIFNSEEKQTCEVALTYNDDITLYVHLSGIAAENGEQCLVSAVDITELKETEFQLNLAKEKAEESDRLKSSFLANMSHEIRTPMNGILGFTELLKDHNLKGDEQDNYISIIETSGTRLLNIINDIISISKVESGQMEISSVETNINEQVEFLYNFFKPEAEQKGLMLKIRNSLPAKESIILTDKEKIFAILTNIVKNAINNTNEGSIEFGYEKKGTYLEFLIKDTGVGIPTDRQEAIFERFIQSDFSDKMAKQGTGLGLSISKAYVEMLGGKIWVESEIEKGSTFYFTIPYTYVDEKKETDNHLSEKVGAIDEIAGQTKKLKILIAEDDEASEMFLTIANKKFSNDILISKTGVETVQMCRENPDIDLVLMDIQMPEIDGYEATRQIRKFNKEIIIIAQTAFDLPGEREKALEAGCDDYISKPIKQADLKELIHKHCYSDKIT